MTKIKITISFWDCWEGGTVAAKFSEGGPPDEPIYSPTTIILKDYSRLKEELVKYNVFSAKEWHILDQLPDAVDKINELIESKPRNEVFIRCYHFSNQSKGCWAIVVKKYINRGGDIKNLTLPMPLPLNGKD